ncbi:hypothetical protein AWH51_03525 [Clavibacter tessellarius]|uniref:RES domain-containing protein n=1 Tax=Clavibacter tessellarius TaxID=31965 RepID=A0A154V4Q0_9MICO|nr:hypothetical protein AWH51_03525 [Clavibacter michiganensis subsp. tessellarius]
MSVPAPPTPFTAIPEVVAAGSRIHRIHSDRFGPAEFNPGAGAPTRFAFFGDPVVPVLYAGDTEDVAICETILHDVPLSGGVVGGRDLAGRRCSRLIATRDLRLASLVGGGPRALRVRAASVCATDAADYPQTVAWAEASHAAGFDGLAYPSRQAAGRRAMVLFGDRVGTRDLEPDPAYRWWFDDADGFARLYEMCRPLGVTVLRLA